MRWLCLSYQRSSMLLGRGLRDIGRYTGPVTSPLHAGGTRSRFAEDRDWEQVHTPKDLVMARPAKPGSRWRSSSG